MHHRLELQALVELARIGNMRRAAEALGISQSTLSDCVARLETAYGAALFERDRRGSRPTVYGRVVVDAAAQALGVMNAAGREIALIKGSASGRLAIGAEAGLIEPFLTEAILRALERNPQLRFRLLALDSGRLVQEVRERRIDFFLGVPPDVPTGGLVLDEIGATVTVPFVRHGHPLTRLASVTLRDIMDFPLVQGPSARWFVRRVADALRAESGQPDRQANPMIVVNDFGVVRSVVRRTDGVGFAVAPMLAGDFERQVFTPLELPPPQRRVMQVPLLVGTLEGRGLPPAVRALVEELRAVVGESA